MGTAVGAHIENAPRTWSYLLSKGPRDTVVGEMAAPFPIRACSRVILERGQVLIHRIAQVTGWLTDSGWPAAVRCRQQRRCRERVLEVRETQRNARKGDAVPFPLRGGVIKRRLRPESLDRSTWIRSQARQSGSLAGSRCRPRRAIGLLPRFPPTRRRFPCRGCPRAGPSP